MIVVILLLLRYLIASGEQIASREATECFFAMTKLFQSQNINLRKMMCVLDDSPDPPGYPPFHLVTSSVHPLL